MSSKELKQRLKEEKLRGEAPEWLHHSGYQILRNKGYLDQTETVKERFTTVSDTLVKHLPESFQERYKTIFFDLLWSGKLSMSTPVFTNVGKPYKGCPISCSGGYVADSIDGFYSSSREVALMSKNGFGTSSYLGDIRSRGSSISDGGTAEGIVPVMETLFDTVSKVSQSSSRRGSIATYTDIDTQDFDELIHWVENNTDGTNIGWNISDNFIERYFDKEPEAIRRFQEVMYLRMLGKGYLHFVDRVNRQNPDAYYEHNIDVKASNLCVVPETMILTKKGYVEIGSVVGERVSVWNGSEWSKVDIVKTGVNQEVLKVNTDFFNSVECTPYHKFIIADTTGERLVEAKDLKPGDKLIKFDFPEVPGGKNILDLSYENGFFTADGSCYKNKNIIYLYGEKKSLEYGMDLNGPRLSQPDQDRVVYPNVKGLQDKFFIPGVEYTLHSRLSWLEGLLDGDGCVTNNQGCQSIQLSSIELEFLQELRYFLQTLGVSCKITDAKPEGKYFLPANNGSGENKQYNCKRVWRILIPQAGINSLLDLGFHPRRLMLGSYIGNREATRFLRVKSVEITGRKSDTFCFTEPKRNRGVFNGMLLGNCSETSLHSSEEYSFTCCLSSLNLSRWDEITPRNIRDSIYFLDCVNSEFIKVAEDRPGLEKAVRFAEWSRPVGLGAMGLGTYLQEKMIPFDSLTAKFKNIEIFKRIRHEAETANYELAEMLGEPELLQGTGRRASHLLACAPNMSSALIMGGVSNGIEPVFASIYTQETSGGDIRRASPKLHRILKERGQWTKPVIESCIEMEGSVQHLDCLTKEEKEVFKTAFEVNQTFLLRMADDRARYIDQSQSVNLFFNALSTEKEIGDVHREALRMKYLKSLYYIRSIDTKNSKIKHDQTCSNCEG